MALSDLRGILKFVYPVQKGKISDIDSLEKIFQNSLDNTMKITPEKHEIAITIAPIISNEEIQSLLEFFLVKHPFNALYLIPEPIAISLYYKKLDSIVINLGYEYSYFTLVSKGLLENRFTQVNNFISFKSIKEVFISVLSHTNNKNFGSINSIIWKDLDTFVLEKSNYKSYSENNLKNDTILQYETETVMLDIKAECLFLALESVFNPRIANNDELGLGEQITKFHNQFNNDFPIIITGSLNQIMGIEERVKEKTGLTNIIYEKNQDIHWLSSNNLIIRKLMPKITKNDYLKNTNINEIKKMFLINS